MGYRSKGLYSGVQKKRLLLLVGTTVGTGVGSAVRSAHARSDVYITERVIPLSEAVCTSAVTIELDRPTRWSVGAVDSYWELLQAVRAAHTKLLVPPSPMFVMYLDESHRVEAAH